MLPMTRETMKTLLRKSPQFPSASQGDQYQYQYLVEHPLTFLQVIETHTHTHFL